MTYNTIGIKEMPSPQWHVGIYNMDTRSDLNTIPTVADLHTVVQLPDFNPSLAHTPKEGGV